LAFIRAWLANRMEDVTAVSILYGGSVKGGTALELFALPDADGGLIGGASLVAEEFLTICRAAVGGS
jgi:triosephosphate isomerase